MKLDAIFFAAHPDDAELGCAGTIAKMTSEGKKIGIVDLTRGELGTRGTPELRHEEAESASGILKIMIRENMGFQDGFFENDSTHKLKLIRVIRKYQPKLALINAPYDRHPDHGRAALLVREACFLSGLVKIETYDEASGNLQTPWRPMQVFNYIQDHFLTPSFVIDITSFFDLKLEAVRAFGSQFFNPGRKDEPETYISTQMYLEVIKARAQTFGHMIGVEYGEGYIVPNPVKLKSPLDWVED